MPWAIINYIVKEIPDSNIRGGMNTKSKRWGLIFSTISADLPISPKKFLRIPNKIPHTRSMGVKGSLNFLQTSLKSVPVRLPTIRNKTTRVPVSDSEWSDDYWS